MMSFQARVGNWMAACFPPSVAIDITERGDRLLEETLELLQSQGYTPDRVAALTEYVFGRPVGETKLEVGGVAVCLAAYCNAVGVDQEEAAEAELVRIWTIIDRIREKWRGKTSIFGPPS